MKAWKKPMVVPRATSALKGIFKAGKSLEAIWTIQGHPVTHCVVMGKDPMSPVSSSMERKNQGILTKLLANASWQNFGAPVSLVTAAAGGSLAAPLTFCVYLPQVTATAPQAVWPALPPQTSSPAIQFREVFTEELPSVRKLSYQISPRQY